MSLLAGVAKMFGGGFNPLASFMKIGGGGAGKNMLGKLGDLGSGLGAGAAAGYTPYAAQTVTGGSKASLADQKGLNAQYQALDMTRANTGQGFTGAEKQNLGYGIKRVNQNTAARSNALAQQQAARGLGGSGLGIALRAQNEQTGANAANEAGINAQNTANQRALSSISQLGSLGADINEGAFNRGQAADALNMFNVSQQNQAASGNAGNQMGQNQFNVSQYMGNRANQLNNRNQRADRNIKIGGALLSAGGAAMGGM